MSKKEKSGKAKPRKIEFVAKLDGVIVARRVSAVPYTHAIVVQENEEEDRAHAHAIEPNQFDREYFDKHTKIAQARPGDRHPDKWLARLRGHQEILQRDIDDAKEEIAGGFEAFCQRQRAKRITWFEEKKAKGGFEPKVEKWLRQEQVVEATARANEQHAADPGNWKFMRVVSVESAEGIDIASAFAKLSKTTQRTVLADVCEKMIARKAWDEIAAFLIGQLGPEDAPVVLKLVRGF